jgi:hypothetical protein
MTSEEMRHHGMRLPPTSKRHTLIPHFNAKVAWDEPAVQSTNQLMEGLAINALAQLYQPDLLTTGPAAKVCSGKGFAGRWRSRRHGEPAGPGVDRQGLPAGSQP